MDTIGVICEPDDAVFGRAAERLAARGFDVEFLPPGEPIRPEDIDALDALANRTICRQAFDALSYADRNGVETLNGFFPTTALSCRLVVLNALEQIGYRVPAIAFKKPDADYVGKNRFRWDGPAGVDADPEFYQQAVGTEPSIERYYALDDGIETHLQALTIRTKLTERRPVLEETTVRVQLATRIRELLDRFDARAIGVDFVVDEHDECYAVDISPVPSFDGAGMERRLADSLASLTTIGA
ncbi:hypothetical protein IL252_03725 [Halomicrobium sp. IBSBa]|uniref:hypothetical protein n=1 Tax=Halomicrobium sp. IBSBa TaxID=2778916 RepID=UPI001ABF949D|nr:hypothetical protein [Halomicrobium sp. IBSBa]MBO4246929.1 hypothetical protein [Halomicrobium sp. IBSBa]